MPNLIELDLWIIITGVLCALACALLGSFLVLRKMSMMGDAISHAVLPGLAVAFLLTGSRASLPMFLGAAVVGVLTAVFTEWVRGFGKVDEGASMGVVFTALFAIGLIMIVQAADHVDLDPGCVLYGAIELTPVDTLRIFGALVPRAAVVLSIVLTINVLAVALFYKELKISSFDPALATTLGINARLMHYLLMTLVAITTVAAFESVGSILVVAMLIVPPAAAYLLTDRLWVMLVLGLVLAALSAVLGHLGAITIPRLFGYSSTSTAGMMAVAAGVLLGLAALFSPRHGLISRTAHRMLLSLRILREDILGRLYRAEERAQPATAGDRPENRAGASGECAAVSAAKLRHELLAGRAITTLAMALARLRGLVSRDEAGYRLTERGRDQARQLLRSHRLWETYLATEADVPAIHLHDSADRLEHARHLTDKLDQTLDRPARDPHDDEIPR